MSVSLRMDAELALPPNRSLFEALLSFMSEVEVIALVRESQKHDTGQGKPERPLSAYLLEILNRIQLTLVSGVFKNGRDTKVVGILTGAWTARSTRSPFLAVTTCIVETLSERVIVRAMNERVKELGIERVNNGSLFDGLQIGKPIVLMGLKKAPQDNSYFAIYARGSFVYQDTLSDLEIRAIHHRICRDFSSVTPESYLSIPGSIKGMTRDSLTRCTSCNAIMTGTLCKTCGGVTKKDSEFYRGTIRTAIDTDVPCTFSLDLGEQVEQDESRLVWFTGKVAQMSDHRTLRVRDIHGSAFFDYAKSMEHLSRS